MKNRRLVRQSHFASFALAFIPLSTLLVTTGFTLPQSTPDTHASSLATADMFMEYWVLRDSDSEIKLLAHGRRPKSSAWDEQFSGLSNPHHAAFEIFGVQQKGPSRVIYTVRSFDDYTGDPDKVGVTSEMQIALRMNANGQWEITSVPWDGMPSKQEVVPAGYVHALENADLYLKTWRTKDERLAYELMNGRLNSQGHFVFDAHLDSPNRIKKIQIEVARTKGGVWRVVQ